MIPLKHILLIFFLPLSAMCSLTDWTNALLATPTRPDDQPRDASALLKSLNKSPSLNSSSQTSYILNEPNIDPRRRNRCVWPLQSWPLTQRVSVWFHWNAEVKATAGQRHPDSATCHRKLVEKEKREIKKTNPHWQLRRKLEWNSSNWKF